MQRFYNPGADPFPSGKLTAGNIRKPIKAQTGLTCLLKLLRRLAYMDHADVTASKLYKEIKAILINFNSIKENDDTTFTQLLAKGNNLCEKFNINFKDKALLDRSFQISYTDFKKNNPSTTIDTYFENIDLYKKCNLLYTVIVNEYLMPYMNIGNSSWNPSDKNAFETLSESLKNSGPHLFMGKFGVIFYPIGSENQQQKLSSSMRHIFTFDKTKYSNPGLAPHWIMVEEVRIESNIQMVIYSDPNNGSDPSQPAKLYMMRYELFVNRLTDRLGCEYSAIPHDNGITFGLVSKDFSNHYLQNSGMVHK